jgi:hypothetical protein
MSPFENIVDAIHALSTDEKHKLRLLLDAELQSGLAPAASPRQPDPGSVGNSSQRAKRIIGLFADESELMDRVMESVYELRSRPLRVSS